MSEIKNLQNKMLEKKLKGTEKEHRYQTSCDAGFTGSSRPIQHLKAISLLNCTTEHVVQLAVTPQMLGL